MCNFALYKYTHNYMTDIASYFPITNPTIIFFVVLLIILFAPIIMGKLRIPHHRHGVGWRCRGQVWLQHP